MNEHKNCCLMCKYYDYPHDFRCEDCEDADQYEKDIENL